MLSYPMFFSLLVILFIGQPCELLHCYECQDAFTTIWLPQTCQFNATGAPVRECNDQQSFCFVTKVTVVKRVTNIQRGCTDDCEYGCQMSDFGLTSLTCTTCCTTELCNTGDGADQIKQYSGLLLISVMWSILLFRDTYV
ncbi:prostate stem cell antigen [Biomphalaria glabrata]|uniref:Snake toxin/toxin-like domain-containing protein n=1 Tax=Biomphalaria glabrata TaxID=6526 RepID=A0A2C9LUJ8_BIOGL|nr:prostate stem cell antigen [Biomphalaria glabrata]